MKAIIVDFDTFAYACPFFTSKTDVNGGYGCTHPECDASETDENGVETGCCMNGACPLCSTLDEDAFNDPDVDRDGVEPGDVHDADGDFDGEDHGLVFLDEDPASDVSRALDAYRKYLNRYN